MSDYVWEGPLYNFLRLCEESPLEKKILDCGAGGEHPPLALFCEHGYETAGVEIQDQALKEADLYCADHGVQPNIVKGDMRKLPFEDASFSFAYSHCAIFFMLKPDIARAIGVMIRVLRPGGLIYVNLLSVDDSENREFADKSWARHLLGSERFSKHEDNEPDLLFADMLILRKEKHIIDTFWDNDRLIRIRIDYMAQK